MRLQPATITLGDASWVVRPLTVAQVQAIEPLLLSAAEAKTGAVVTAISILRIALGRDHAEAAAALDDIEAAAPEIAKAMAQVLRLGGFLPDGDALPGEAAAGRNEPRPAASIGAGSTPA